MSLFEFELTSQTSVKLMTLLVMYSFLPLSALAYYVFRQDRSLLKTERILNLLEMDHEYRDAFRQRGAGGYLSLAVAYSSVVSVVGLTALLLGDEIGLDEITPFNLGTAESPTHFPAPNSMVILGMAFLGAYLWGIQYVFRRYNADDLDPAVYFGLSLRMMLAGALSVVIFNAFEALSGGANGGSSGLSAAIWPAMAFVLGMFPQRGLAWLRERIPIFSPQAHPSVRPAPLRMIEGISVHDRLRLEECGIADCYDLANADFVPLVLSTPYSARAIVDWILQAKLCAHCHESVHDLRQCGVRTIVDLANLTEAEIVELVDESTARKTALIRARRSVEDNPEIRRLLDMALRLGHYTASIEGGGRSTLPDDEAPGPTPRAVPANIWHEHGATRPEAANRPQSDSSPEATPAGRGNG